jgi:hypothetical protein
MSSTPEPSADHDEPFHLAMFATGLPPAMVSNPPTYRFDPETANASGIPVTPEPSDDQLPPFHLAMHAVKGCRRRSITRRDVEIVAGDASAWTNCRAESQR